MTISLEEHVAQAICCPNGCDAKGRLYDPIGGSVPTCHASGFADSARAAIATMREHEGAARELFRVTGKASGSTTTFFESPGAVESGAQRTRRLRIVSRFRAWVTVTHRLGAVLGETGRTQQRERPRTSPTPSRRARAKER
jgi:hypothetical protein